MNFIAQLGHTLRGRGPDGGPMYLETNLDRFIAEPFNAVSAALFLLIVVYWLVRLRGQYRTHLFITCCLPLLLVGGIGGTVYHALRAHRVWLVMDWMPITILCIATGIYLWSKVLKRWWWALLIVPAVFVFQMLNFGLLRRQSIQLAILNTYILMGTLILAPAALVLWKTRGRHIGLVMAATVCFGLAVFSRTADAWWPQSLPMGTHFLWHVFGAAAAQFLIEYLYRLGPGRARSAT